MTKKYNAYKQYNCILTVTITFVSYETLTAGLQSVHDNVPAICNTMCTAMCTAMSQQCANACTI